MFLAQSFWVISTNSALSDLSISLDALIRSELEGVFSEDLSVDCILSDGNIVIGQLADAVVVALDRSTTLNTSYAA